MRQKLRSLRVFILLPVVSMTLLVVILLTTLFSRSYTDMILRQEQDANAAGFDMLSQSITPLINTAVTEARIIMSDERVTQYARLNYRSEQELIHARIACRDFLQAELTRQDGIYGLLFMREDGSIFGSLPDGNYFLDDPQDNPLPEDIRAQILGVSRGQTVWVGPVSEETLYGFDHTPENIMIAAWQNVDVNYGLCYGLMLINDSLFTDLFSMLEDGKSTWYLFSADRTEIYHTGRSACLNPDRLIQESNRRSVFQNENGVSVCAFSADLSSPDWTLVREVSMEDYEQVILNVRRTVFIVASVVLLIALGLYRLWLRMFMRQFNTLLDGIKRMGQGELQPLSEAKMVIGEFQTMQQEIDRTSLALDEQMRTIREMERRQMEQENLAKEQARIVEELNTARQIQSSVLPHIFPPFPERREIDLYATMDPARDVGGDFYDFFFIDEDHLCLVIADVSGKGIPASLFMMFSKRIIEDYAKAEHSVSEVLARTNDALCDNNQAEMFVSVWLGILELSTGMLTAANAGHEYLVLGNRDTGFTLIKDRHDFVIGGIQGMKYREYTLHMDPGDKLFVYTDGVPEATAGTGKMFGTDRMLDALNSCADGTPEEILRAVRSAVDAFVGEAEQFDDLTMMCVEFKGPIQ